MQVTNPDSKNSQRKKEPGCCGQTFNLITADKVINMSFFQSMICNCVVIVVMFLISVLIAATKGTLEEVVVDLNTECKTSGTCRAVVNIPNKIPKPVYIYLGFENFFLNHRKVFNSKSLAQLAGTSPAEGTLKSKCDPKYTNAHMGKTMSWGGTALTASAIASPCGTYASLFPSDTVALYKRSGASTAKAIEAGDTKVEISTQNIVWSQLKGNKFKKETDSQTKQWVDPEMSHFSKWMKIPQRPNFEKLWGIVENVDLEAGNYLLDLNYDASFDHDKVTKRLVIRNLNWRGGDNQWVLFSYLGVAVLMLLMNMGMYYVYMTDKDK